MENTDNVQHKNNDNRSLWIPVIIALVAALSAFFLPDGVYDFRWVRSLTNWMIYFTFALVLFGGQMTTRFILFRKSKGYTLISSLLGLAIGIGVVIFFLTFIFPLLG
jgi:hypothetical protein